MHLKAKTYKKGNILLAHLDHIWMGSLREMKIRAMPMHAGTARCDHICETVNGNA